LARVREDAPSKESPFGGVLRQLQGPELYGLDKDVFHVFTSWFNDKRDPCRFDICARMTLTSPLVGRSACAAGPKGRSEEEVVMADSVYRVTELIGTSSQSWEAAARLAVETAAKTLRDLRVAEVVEQDMTIENGKVTSYRVKLNVSFKYLPEK